MRGIEVLLLAAFVGLIGLGIWNARQWLPEWGAPPPRSTAVEPAHTARGLGTKTGTKSVRLGGTRVDVANRSSEANDLVLPAFPVSKTDVYVSTSEFPTGKDLPVGASGAQIRARYGEPTARVTEMRGGRVLEHYYYFNSDRTQLTTATLEGGRLIAADSTSR